MNIIELNYSKPTKNVPNFGIELLKTILFFFILVYHCYYQNLGENKILKIILANSFILSNIIYYLFLFFI